MKLNIRRQAKKRLPSCIKQMLYQTIAPNKVWNIDLMSDSLRDGRKFGKLNVIDNFNRKVLAKEADALFLTLRVISVLERIKECRGLPEIKRVDTGSEFISEKLELWCIEKRFNGKLRKELLNAYMFQNIKNVSLLDEE